MKKILKNINDFFIKIINSFKRKTNSELDLYTTPDSGCVTMIVDEEEQNQLELEISNFKKSNRKAANETLIIPLVFHIIHKGEPEGYGTNISDAQIYSAVNALNEDFSKELNTNGDGNGVKTPFRFVLMNKDDQGNFSTGIYRFNGAAASTLYNENGVRNPSLGVTESILKNWSRQNNQHAYNVWVVSEIEGNNGGSGIQGFAYFPTTSIVDGIVQLYNATGIKHPDSSMGPGEFSFTLKSYTNLNKTLTHEMGHAFSLFHTFQGNSCTETNCALQGDRVCDTPATIKNSNGNYPACGGTQQVENYMDYTGQTFKNMFTQGQNDRMVAAATFLRANLLQSNALDNLQSIVADCSLQIISPKTVQCSSSNSYLTVKVTNTSDQPIHKLTFDYIIGSETGSYEWYGPIMKNSVVGSDIISIAETAITESSFVQVTITSINDNPANVIATKAVIIPTRAPYKIKKLRDVLDGQISWNITGAITGQVLYENPTPKNFSAGVLETFNCCLPDGNYIFTVTDTMPGLQTPNAYIKLIDDQGNVLVNATDGFSTIVHEFTVGNIPNKSPDINKDGIVNVLDISILSAAFGSKLGDPNYNELADLNNDGMINIKDLSIMSQNFGNTIQ